MLAASLAATCASASRSAKPEAFRIYAEKDIALLHTLIVANEHFGHEAGNIRCDDGDIRAYPAVARPGRVDVIIPEANADENGRHDSNQRRQRTQRPSKVSHAVNS